MKYIIALLAVFSMIACKRDKHYTCVCHDTDGKLEVYTAGRMPEEQAYAKCKTYTDSNTTCIVEVR